MFFKVLGRIFGRFFGGIGGGLMGFFRWIGRHEAALGVITIVTVVLFGIWFLLSLLNVNVVFGSPQPVAAPLAASQSLPQATVTPAPTTPTPVPVSKTDAPPATVAFMTGQMNANADQVWSALNAELHTEFAGKGRDKTYFQRLFESLKKSGVNYEGYQYIGGVPGADGGSIHFYVLTASGNDKKTTQIPWTFVLDKDGKIAQIESPLLG